MKRIFAKHFVVTCIIILLIYFMRNLFSNPDESSQFICQQSIELQENLYKLADRCLNIIRLFHLLHFLCYESLWSQIRLSHIAPWDTTIEFCILNEEIVKIGEDRFKSIFLTYNMRVKYDAINGIYLITDPSFDKIAIHLILFEDQKETGMKYRIGWKRKLLPPDCDSSPSLNCFPQSLIFKPLPRKEFGKLMVPVPKEGIEIQKYHYPNDWWKHSGPLQCSQNLVSFD